MSSTPIEPANAEQRFRQAFDRLKADEPKVLKRGAPVSQNNVAKEAGCDPTALRKTRFPALVREIQAYVELRNAEAPSKRQAALKQKQSRRSVAERLEDATKQRDAAQSLLASANRRIVELTEKVQALQQRLDELQPKPTRLGR